jgi:MOSC domain-containing protein YiiM
MAQTYSINVSQVREVPFAGRTVATGIYKQPVHGEISVGELGLIGDAQADLTVHGGLDKAVYFYPREHYPPWEKLLHSKDLPPGSFGENITCEGLTETELYVGDVLRIGTAVLQVLQPRSPCYKLQMKFGRADMVAQFVKLGLPGWYASVLQPGQFSTGDPIEVVSKAPERITISEIWRYSLVSNPDVETLDRIMQLNLLPAFWKERIARN